jgi:sporulation protein YlmC with PRC-barrel domain
MFDPNHSRETAMLKKLMVTTALTGLMIGAAVAEGTPPSPAPSSPPAATESAPPAKSPDMSAPAPSSSTATPAPSSSAATTAPSSSSAKFVNSQRSDQFLASKFKGTDVIGADDQKIGDVSDILFDKDGKIEAYVVSVGGFLGIGAKDVALAPSAFQMVAGDKSKNESDKLKLATMTKDELKQTANFEPYRAPSSTTGMGGPGGTSRPAGGGTTR